MPNAVSIPYEKYDFLKHHPSIPAAHGYGWRIGNTGLLVRADVSVIDVWNSELDVYPINGRILQSIAHAQGEIVSRDELIYSVWGHEFPYENIISSRIDQSKTTFAEALKQSGSSIHVEDVLIYERDSYRIDHPKLPKSVLLP